MSLIDRIKRASAAFRNVTDISPLVGRTWYGGGKNVPMGADEALRVSAVFRCVDLVSKTMASLPLHMMENQDGGKVKASNHPLYNLLWVQPNRYTTAYDFWQMGIANLLLTRGMFIKIQRDGRGTVKALWNIPTNKVSGEHELDTGTRYIIVGDEDECETLLEDDYIFIPSFRLNSNMKPNDPVSIAADILGLCKDMSTFAANGFSGTNLGGFIEHPAAMSDRAYERFKTSFNENYTGVANSGKWLFLEEGMHAAPWVQSPEATQLLESRKYAVIEVCRIFGVPPHLCMDMDHATFSNIEQQSMEYVRDCISPMCVRIEQALFKDLLTEKEKKKYFFKFNINGLMRGDSASRTTYYHNARQDGWMSANDIRELEDMNRIPPELGGDVYAVNGNMIPLYSVPANLPKGAMNAQAKDEKGVIK